ncbi:MAG: phospholipase D-like domain-containing protein [Actinomycetaceae bacterium]|nr:phospholipase D-like domain-containing protein [Actinomycetaceae bacterium]
MRRLLPPRRRSWQVVKTVALTAVALQATAIAVLVTVDEIRKRRAPGGGGFPALEPQNTQVGDNQVTTYTEGRSLYDDMLTAIDQAQSSIYFETYIWKSDEVGKEFKTALYRAADRGVQVYCIYDGFANLVVDPRFKFFPSHPNLFVRKVPEVRSGLFTLNLRNTGRDHRKVMVVDSNIGFVGGYNIGKLYEEEWRDTHVRIEGDAVWELENGFIDLWNSFRLRRHPKLPQRGARQWDTKVVAALNKPSQMLFPVRGMYIDALERANHHAYLTSAYFIPDAEILAALKDASNRGVEVKVLVPKNSNHVIADWVSSAFFDELLEAGIEIWLYEHAMIHAKTATIDERWSTVGTANIDRLSMFGNHEINLQFHSQDFALQMEKVFFNDLTTSVRLEPEEWARRPLIQRATERLLRPLSPLI